MFKTQYDNVKAIALWAGKYSVSFDLNEGNGTVSSITANSKEEISLPTDIEKDGHQFLGWSDGENIYTSKYTVGYSNVTLTAVYESIYRTYCSITFI